MCDEKNKKTPECESSVNLKAEDYRDPWLAAGVNKAIGFFPGNFIVWIITVRLKSNTRVGYTPL